MVTDVRVTILSVSTALVQWRPPNVTNGRIQYYEVDLLLYGNERDAKQTSQVLPTQSLQQYFGSLGKMLHMTDVCFNCASPWLCVNI